ncbi:MAG: hypothetical protein APF76_04370 [Desulfitibacter sp. BRH_c19]|nr:MAG: hypothetical protein APF76_04370 [Desulfitibacter sp. BRH_c19]
MRIYKEISEEIKQIQNSYVILGNFDGVHLGHRELIQKSVEQSMNKKGKSIIYTFSPHPEQLLSPDSFSGYITSPNIKEQLLEECGIDILIYHPFSKEFSLKTPEEFIKDYLVRYLKPKKVFVGFNFSFGRGGKGNPAVLSELGKKYNFQTQVEPPVYLNQLPISSSRIRQCLEVGDINLAKSLLGYWPKLEGRVVSGDKMGRQLGFPTANLFINNDIILPKTGVYATYTTLDGEKYKSVTNIGFKPTFSAKSLSVEIHILNFTKNLYGENLQISFVQKLRDEKRFTNVNELKQQISFDVNIAKTILDKVLT